MDNLYPVVGPDVQDRELQRALQADIEATKQMITSDGLALAHAYRGGMGSLKNQGLRSLGHHAMSGSRAFSKHPKR